MKFYTDGSRINGKEGFIIGWSAVCELGVLASSSQIGGSMEKEDIWGNLFADYVATYESQKLRDSLS